MHEIPQNNPVNQEVTVFTREDLKSTAMPPVDSNGSMPEDSRSLTDILKDLQSAQGADPDSKSDAAEDGPPPPYDVYRQDLPAYKPNAAEDPASADYAPNAPKPKQASIFNRAKKEVKRVLESPMVQGAKKYFLKGLNFSLVAFMLILASLSVAKAPTKVIEQNLK